MTRPARHVVSKQKSGVQHHERLGEYFKADRIVSFSLRGGGAQLADSILVKTELGLLARQ